MTQKAYWPIVILQLDQILLSLQSENAKARGESSQAKMYGRNALIFSIITYYTNCNNQSVSNSQSELLLLITTVGTDLQKLF